jgi:hypothetical protein
MIKNQDNGNTQLNDIRNDFNDRVQTKSFMGRTNRVIWANKRRFRTI